MPLFNAARTERDALADASRNAAARAPAAEEAEGECEAQAGAGGMDTAAAGRKTTRREHGYAPASSEEYAEGFEAPEEASTRVSANETVVAPARFDGDAAPLAPGSGGFNSGRATGLRPRC